MVFCGYIPSNGIAGLYGSTIFNFLRHFHTVFHVAAPVYIPTNGARGFVPLSSCPRQHLTLVFLMKAILTGVILIVALIHISQVTSDVERFFIYLLAI